MTVNQSHQGDCTRQFALWNTFWGAFSVSKDDLSTNRHFECFIECLVFSQRVSLHVKMEYFKRSGYRMFLGETAGEHLVTEWQKVVTRTKTVVQKGLGTMWARKTFYWDMSYWYLAETYFTVCVPVTAFNLREYTDTGTKTNTAGGTHLWFFLCAKFSPAWFSFTTVWRNIKIWKVCRNCSCLDFSRSSKLNV